jgi:hypothetical protein
MAAIEYPYDQCREFAKLRQLVRAEVSEVSNLIPLVAYLPLSDCTCDRQRQRSPNCVRRHENVESHDLWKSQERCSKRNGHHHEQKSHDVKEERRDDMESSQIY